MATSGTVHSITFTPEFTGQLTVTVKFDGDSTTADGGYTLGKIFKTQSSSTVYGTPRPVVDGDGQTWRYTFAITSTADIECGLYGYVGGGPAGETFENIYVTAQLQASA